MSLTSSKLGWPRRRRTQSPQLTRETGVGWSAGDVGSDPAVGGDVSRETSPVGGTDPIESTAAESAVAGASDGVVGDSSSNPAEPPTAASVGQPSEVSSEVSSEATNAEAHNVAGPAADVPAPDVPAATQSATEPVTADPAADLAADGAAATEPAAEPRNPTPRPATTRIMTVSNQKGGVGKTTTTVNLAAALAIAGQRVLVIDLDPQGNASTGLSIAHPSGTPSTYDVIVDKMPLEQAVQPVSAPGIPDGYLVCVPATGDLAGAEVELAGVMVGREFRLRHAISEFLGRHTGEDRFDYVFIDCPPSLGLLTVNALAAGAEVLIPVQCEYYALEGLGQLLETVELIKGYLNPNLHVSTMLLTMFDARTKLAGQVVDEVRAHFGDTVMRSIIPRSVKVSEAPSYGMSVISYDPTSRGAIAYDTAARELTTRG